MKDRIQYVVLALAISAPMWSLAAEDEARDRRAPRQDRSESNTRPDRENRMDRQDRSERLGQRDRDQGPEREGRPARRNVPPLIAALDRNGDGIIDENEMEHATEALKKLDRNGDGKLVVSELMRGNMQPMRGQRMWARGPAMGRMGPMEMGRRMGPPGFGGWGPMGRQGQGFSGGEAFGPPWMARRPGIEWGQRFNGPRPDTDREDGFQRPGLRDGRPWRPGIGPEASVRPRDFGPPPFGPRPDAGMGPRRGPGPVDGERPQMGPPGARDDGPGFRSGRGPEAGLPQREFAPPRERTRMGAGRPMADDGRDFDSPGPREPGRRLQDAR